MKVKELRIVLTEDNLEEMIRFYRSVAGMETSKEWQEETGNGMQITLSAMSTLFNE